MFLCARFVGLVQEQFTAREFYNSVSIGLHNTTKNNQNPFHCLKEFPLDDVLQSPSAISLHLHESQGATGVSMRMSPIPVTDPTELASAHELEWLDFGAADGRCDAVYNKAKERRRASKLCPAVVFRVQTLVGTPAASSPCSCGECGWTTTAYIAQRTWAAYHYVAALCADVPTQPARAICGADI